LSPQQPVEQELASHTQTPPTQACPTAQPCGQPPDELPAEDPPEVPSPPVEVVPAVVAQLVRQTESEQQSSPLAQSPTTLQANSWLPPVPTSWQAAASAAKHASQGGAGRAAWRIRFIASPPLLAITDVGVAAVDRRTFRATGAGRLARLVGIAAHLAHELGGIAHQPAGAVARHW
jgi:hypothetical protein